MDGTKTNRRVVEPHHLDDLRSSGLSDETIREAGIFTESNTAKISGWLNRRYAKRRGSALVFPFRDLDGEPTGYRRLKPTAPMTDRNGRKIKYESPSKSDNQAYFPPAALEAINDPSTELIVVEGEKKSLKATQEGFPTIGLVGVYGWKLGKGADRLIRDLDAIEWRDRRVIIVFDSDIAENENIQDAESRLAAQLMRRGARVKVARLPDSDDGSKVGIDDFLISHDGAALRKLLDRAGDPEPLKDDHGKEPLGALDPMPIARDYLAERHVHDQRRILAFWRGDFYRWNGIYYRAIPEDELRADFVQYADGFASGINRSAVSNIIECVKSETIIPARDDPPRWLSPNDWDPEKCIATKSGVLPVESLNEKPIIIEPTPDFYTVNGLDFDFDPQAKCPQWHEFLRQLWPDDPDSISTLQEIFGYLLLPDTSQQKLFMLIGPKRSGKGTIGRVLKAVVGEANCCAPTLGSLSGPFGKAPLQNKTLAVIGDARIGGRADSPAIVENLLSISGEDPQDIHRKHRDAIQVSKMPVRFVLMTNELPKLTDSSGTVASRFIVLRMTESFYGREDVSLTSKLMAELPGILNWAIHGWQRLDRRGYFVQPERSRELIDDLEQLSSSTKCFLRDRCEIDSRGRTLVDRLYHEFKNWCEANGRHAGSVQSFGRDLQAAAPGVRIAQPRDPLTGGRLRVYEGVRLIDGGSTV